MSATKNGDRTVRAWLDLMPDEAPDRAIAAVLQAIETTPQQRTLRWLTWRLFPMNRLPVVMVAALVVAIAGLAILFRSGAPGNVAAPPSPQSTAPPTPSASATAAAASSESSLATEIQARWMSGNRSIVGGTAGTTMLVGADRIAISPANSNGSIVLVATARDAGPGRFELASTPASDACAEGERGTYVWTRSATGKTLTITAERDDCSAREAAVPGEWLLMACADPDDNCLGTIDAGAYFSQFIAPRLDVGTGWFANYGALRYIVPDGWANGADWPETFSLEPASDYPPPNGSDPARSILVLAHPTAISQATACSGTVDDTVGTSVDDLTSWLQSVPGLKTSRVASAQINRHRAVRIDVQVDPSWTKRCSGETQPIIEILKKGELAVVGAERQRIFLVDLGQSHVVAIVIRSADPAKFDAFVEEATPIVESFIFE